jgi:hypothetical protein
MIARKLCFVPVVFWAGCAARNASPDLPLDHPANPAAPEAEFVPPPDVLATEGKAPEPVESGGPHGEHESHSHAGHAQGSESHEAVKKGGDGYPLSVCVVSGEELGSMGEPVVIQHEGREVRFCCKSCVEKFRKDPAKYLTKLDEAKKANEKHEHPTAPPKEGSVPEPHH